MSESIAYKKSFELAIEIVTYCKWLKESKHEYEMAKQLIKSGTSIGANLAEANGAISINDFSNKVSIAYKECLETKYWLQLLEATNNIFMQMLINLQWEQQ